MRSEGIAVAYARFDLESMRRVTSDRWSSYSTAVNSGVLSIDEVRADEGLAALPNGEGEKHYIPLNLAPVDAEPDVSSE